MEKILPQDSNIRGILLTNGIEWLAKCVKTETGVTVTSPVRSNIARDTDGSLVLDIRPISLIAPLSYNLESHAIASIYPVTKEVEDGYLQFVSGIAMGSSLLQG